MIKVLFFKFRNIYRSFENFNKTLTPRGQFIFSVPYKQPALDKLGQFGYHQTFNIAKNTIKNWLRNSNFKLLTAHYQSMYAQKIN